jgi:3-isopropylmalate/(R)-2-methylmalate dehydratase small subunit
VELSEPEVRALMAEGGARIDLEVQEVEFAGRKLAFEIDPEVKYRLMNGLDDIGISLEREEDIARYERERERPGPVTTAL